MKSPDLINLRKWMRKAPKEFDRAGANVLNSVAFKGRRRGISLIKKGTTTRTPKFVDRSMRVTKAKVGQPLNRLVAIMGSVDISGKGRSTGFEELESGIVSRNKRVPLMAARKNQERKVASRPIRMDKARSAFRVGMFRGKGSRKAKVVRMLMAIRNGAIGAKPFLIPRGVRTKHAKMPAGLWKKGKGGLLIFMNPIKANVHKRTKRIRWMTRAIGWAIRESNVTKAWKKEAEFVLRKRKR